MKRYFIHEKINLGHESNRTKAFAIIMSACMMVEGVKSIIVGDYTHAVMLFGIAFICQQFS